ncbi:MAG: hypothetical protein BMS9Abin26_0839 [Gammaproteobacteria bacterium]|nr:MAG: hypothetical protein BMS9Abin26_0839 [Gammaproteobacteria bacterium]
MKFGLTAKVALLAGSLVILTTLAVAITFYINTNKLLVDEALSNFQRQNRVEGISLQHQFRMVKQDLKFLARLPAIRDISRAHYEEGYDELADRKWRTRLAGAFKSFMENRDAYLDIRLVGVFNNGRDLVRVERNKQNFLQISGDDELIENEQRPYFRETFKQPPGEVYYFGVIHKWDYHGVKGNSRLILSVTVPIYNLNGTAFGFIIIDVDFTGLLKKAELPYQTGGSTNFITNNVGEYLLHPDKEKIFGQHSIQRRRIYDDYPAISGYFSTDFKEDFLIAVEGDDAQLIVINKVLFNEKVPEGYISLASTRAYDDVIADSIALRNRTAGLILVLLLLSFIPVLFFSHRLIMPLRRLAVAVGEFSRSGKPVSMAVKSSDELGLLATAIEDMSLNVTAQHHMLEDSQQRLDAIIGSAAEGIITIDDTGIIEQANTAVLQMFGYEKDELTGLNISILMPEPYQGNHDEYLASYKRTGIKHIIGFNRELPGLRKDGSIFSLGISIAEIKLGDRRVFTGMLRDITARKEAELVNVRLGRIIDEAATEIYVISAADLHFIQVNKSAQDNLDYSLEELESMTPIDIKPLYDRDTFSDLLDPLRSGKLNQVHFETLHQRKDGSVYPVEILLQAFLTEAPPIFVAMVTDISERKEAEEKLVVAKEEAEAASTAKTEFLSRMSHELRTPMNAILGFAQLMQTDTDNPPRGIQVDNIDQILKAGWHLLELINDVLDLARIESGKFQMTAESVDVNEVIKDCIDLAAPLTERQNITLTNELPDRGIILHADRVRLKQVLLNLLTNAVKYNVENGEVRITCGEISQGQRRINVIDTGRGIPEEMNERLFNAFERLDSDESIEGTGIGLVISKYIVELMGGSMGMDSVVTEGSTFWFQLPIGDPAITGQTNTDSEKFDDPILSVASAVPDVPRCKVLYVEDNPANLSLVEKIFERYEDIEIISADNGELGLELACAHILDLIILDINLPGIDGFKVLSGMRQIPGCREIPIIALSANAMPREVEKGLQAGFRYYLTKPLDVRRFLTIVEELLGEGATAAE